MTGIKSPNLKFLKIAEPADSPGKVVFTIGVNLPSPLSPNTTWFVGFSTAGGAYEVVQMDTNSSAANPEFVYGIVTGNKGRSEQVFGSLEAGAALASDRYPGN